MKKIFKYIPAFILCAGSSYFLTSVIDRDTIETSLQFGFIFIYFFAISSGVCYCYYKWFNLKNRNSILKTLMVAGMLAILLVTGSYDKIVDPYRPTTVTIKARSEDPRFTENKAIWISNIFVDGESVKLSNYPTGFGWKYIEEWDDIISTELEPEILTFSFPRAEKIQFRFAYYNEFAKTTYIQDGDKEERLITLIPDKEKGFNYFVTSNYNKNSYDSILSILSALMLFCGIFFFLFSVCRKYPRSYITLFIFFYFTIFFTYKVMPPDISVKIAMLLLSLICGTYFSDAINSFKIKKCSKKFISLILIFNFFITFAWAGHSLFLSGDIVEIDIIRIARFIICFFYSLPYIYLTLYFVRQIQRKLNKNQALPNFEEIRKLKVELFLVIFCIISIISLGFYPGNITSDGVDQWAQALGVFPINDAHPATHTLLLRVFASVWENPFFIVLVQIGAFALIMSNILVFFYQKGFSKKILLIIAIILSLLPNNFMMLTLISKNIPFAIVTWWLIYLLIHLFDDPIKFFHDPMKYVQMILSLCLVNLLRHNGFLAVFLVLLLLLVFAVRYLKQLKGLPALVVVGVIFVTQVVQGPVYNAFSVERTSTNVVYPLITPLGSAVKKDVELPEDVLNVMTQITSLEMWRKTYNKFNDDTFAWADPRPNFNNITINQAFSIYLRMLLKHPNIVIKDRLDKMNLLWNVNQPNDGWNNRYAVGIWPPSSITPETLPNLLIPAYKQGEGESYYRENLLTKPLLFILNCSSGIRMADMFLWRNGIYVIIYLLLILFSVYKRHYNIIWISLPAIATLVTYVLMMGWPIYQYLWFFPISVIILILYVLTDNSDETK